jgi:hypothetical protein
MVRRTGVENARADTPTAPPRNLLEPSLQRLVKLPLFIEATGGLAALAASRSAALYLQMLGLCKRQRGFRRQRGYLGTPAAAAAAQR